MRVCGWLLLCAASPLWAAGAFSDVKPDHWAYEAVEELARAEVVSGSADGQFHGNNPVVRYEFAALTLRLAQFAPQVGLGTGEEKLPFTDVRPDHWAAPAIAMLHHGGVIQGSPDGLYNGHKPLARYDLVVMLHRLLAKVVGDEAVASPTPERTFADVPPEHWASPALRGLDKQGIFPANPDGQFEGARAATRYEFAAVGARVLRLILATRPAQA